MTLNTNSGAGPVRAETLSDARLDALPVGAAAIVETPDRSTPTVLRLIEMGLTSGVRVHMTRRAPLGDPLEIRLSSGPRLCLRREDARAFRVREVTK